MSYKIGHLGSYETLPDTAAAVYARDIAKLGCMLEQGMNLNESIPLGARIRVVPLEIAVYRDDISTIRWLLDHGARPEAAEYPLISTAVRYCHKEVVTLLIGQASKLTLPQKRRLFLEAYWGNRLQNIEVLEQAGITIAQYGGEAFRQIASGHKIEPAKLFIARGVDINFHEPDMVYPYASTPVTEAARHNDFDMVKYLVGCGADITIADKYGDRPYTVALKGKNMELATYLKELEPESWHNEQEKARQLIPYKLPAALAEYLKSGPLRLEFPDGEFVKYIELSPYVDTVEVKWARKKLLSLMAEMANFSNYMLVWHPNDQKLWYIDVEHEEFHALCTWEAFLSAPGKYINGMIDGEFEV